MPPCAAKLRDDCLGGREANHPKLRDRLHEGAGKHAHADVFKRAERAQAGPIVARAAKVRYPANSVARQTNCWPLACSSRPRSAADLRRDRAVGQGLRSAGLRTRSPGHERTFDHRSESGPQAHTEGLHNASWSDIHSRSQPEHRQVDRLARSSCATRSTTRLGSGMSGSAQAVQTDPRLEMDLAAARIEASSGA